MLPNGSAELLARVYLANVPTVALLRGAARAPTYPRAARYTRGNAPLAYNEDAEGEQDSPTEAHLRAPDDSFLLVQA